MVSHSTSPIHPQAKFPGGESFFKTGRQTLIIGASIKSTFSSLDLKKRKSNRRNGSASNSSGYTTLSTLGEALREKNPEMMRRVEELQQNQDSLPRMVEVFNDLLPYSWKDTALIVEGIDLTLEKKYCEAIETMMQILDQDPNAYPAYHLLGHIHGCLHDFKLAVEHLRKAFKLHSGYPQVYFDLGQAYRLLGKEKKAFAVFKQGVRLAPEFAVADYWLSFTFDRLGLDWVGPKAGDGSLFDKNALLADTCYHMGNAYIEFGLHASARQALKKAVRIRPDFAEAFYQLGELHIKKLRNPKRAQKYLEKSEQLFAQKNDLMHASQTRQLHRPKDEVLDRDKAAQDWLKEGLRLQGFGRYQGAIDAYKMGIQFKAEFADAYYNVGIAYGSLQDSGVQRLDKAVGALRQVIRLQPQFIHAHIALGASFIKRGDLLEAVDILQDGLALDPLEPNVLYYLGVAHRMSSHHQEAVEYLKKSVELKPDSVQVQFYLASALMDLGRYDEAGEVFQEVVRIKPDFADGHFMLGNLYLENLLDPERAISHLKKAEKLFLKLEDYQKSAHIRQLLELRVSKA